MVDESLLNDPDVSRLLKRRSRLRWGLSGGLIGIYLAYCLAGVYLPDVLARPVPGSSIPWGIALGYLIMALSVFLSVLYIRIVGRMPEVPFGDRESDR
jgi:uncharacterized membrane protein (DUF485 family)